MVKHFMTVDIQTLSYEELLELKHLIEKRLSELAVFEEEKGLYGFTPGDEVNFTHPGLGRQKGTLLEFKKNTVTVITTSGQKWEVSPQLLKKIVISDKKDRLSAKIVKLHSSKRDEEK